MLGKRQKNYIRKNLMKFLSHSVIRMMNIINCYAKISLSRDFTASVMRKCD